MRTALSRLASIAATFLVGAAAFVGCSANGTSGAGLPTSDPTTTPPPDQTKLPPSSSSGDPGDHDAGKDSGKADAATPADAGPPTPNPGDPCPKVDEVFKRSCGACGTQTALCFSEDGGAAAVSDYSTCTGEVVGGCLAGTIANVACGNCGTQKKVCTTLCTWNTTGCSQSTNACKAGVLEYTTVGCPTANTYRQRTCQALCSWGSYTTCTSPANDLVLDINGVVGQTAALGITLAATQMATGIPTGGTCPAASLLAGAYPYAYVEIKNGTAKQATVAVYTSVPAGGTSIYPILAGYKVPFVPGDDVARLLCAYGPSSGTMSNIIIDAGTSMLVYLRSYYIYNAASPAQTTGAINVNVRTDTLL